MSRFVFPVIVVVGLLLAGFAGPTAPAAAQEASPTPTHDESCKDPGVEVAPISAVRPDPESADDGVVIPFMTSGKVLYVVVVTLPPNTCIPYRERDGAVVLFVQEGEIEYTARFTDDPGSEEVKKGHSDGDPATLPTVEVLASEVPINLAVDDWVTQDRKIEYTIRNIGTAPAVAVIASYVDPPWDDDGCNGGCRKP